MPEAFDATAEQPVGEGSGDIAGAGNSNQQPDRLGLQKDQAGKCGLRLHGQDGCRDKSRQKQTRIYRQIGHSVPFTFSESRCS